MLSNASRRVLAVGAGRDWLGVIGHGVKKQENVAGLVSSWRSRRSIVTGSTPQRIHTAAAQESAAVPLAVDSVVRGLGQALKEGERIGRGTKQVRVASWIARRSICTASVLPAQMHTTASRKPPVAALPLPADTQKAGLGELVKKTGRQMTEHLLEGIRGGLANCKGALQSWQFERAQQAKMVTMEDYRKYLGSLSHGELLSEEMLDMFRRLVGLSWAPETLFAPWLLLFRRLFPESMGYDVRVEDVIVDIRGPLDEGPVEINQACLFVRRATLEGDGPVLLIVSGSDKQGQNRLQRSLARLTGRIEKTAAELMRSGQARERMLWLTFCAQDFCWGRIQAAGASSLPAETGLHVQQAEGQRALLQLAEEVHSVLISRA